jgi:hypothetical protein
MKDKDSYNESEETIDTLNDSFFRVSSRDDIPFYIAGVLDISKNVYNKGTKFLKEDKSFAILFDIFSVLYTYVEKKNINAFTFMQEENYVDRVYRDSYYFYFAGKHFCYSRFCKRIFLFANTFAKPILDMDSDELEKDFVGSIVIRPLPKRSVGRTLLNPKYFIGEQRCFIRMADYNLIAFGKKVAVSAFPYSMQDGETATCAEVTILNLLDYYSRSYPEYHYLLPSDINRIAKENGYERSLPTHGLKYEMISKAFCESGFYPKLYSSKKMPKDKFRRILYYYVESGIPLSLGVSVEAQNMHSIIVIGHGKLNVEEQRLQRNLYASYDKKSDNIVWICDAADAVDEFCIMDDAQMPYTLAKCELHEQYQLRLDKYIIETMMVPLYKRMYLEASDANEIFKVILASDEYGVRDSDFEDIESGIPLGSQENPIAVRIFMTSSRSLRKCRDKQFANGNLEVRAWYSTTVFPKFVWVCELSTVSMYSEKVIGEIILDATSSADANADSLIIAHYPKRIFCRLPQDTVNDKSGVDTHSTVGNEDDAVEFHKICKWQPFFPYDSNLYSTKYENE